MPKFKDTEYLEDDLAALIAWKDKLSATGVKSENTNKYAYALERLERLPALDMRLNRKGRWLPTHTMAGIEYYCSECTTPNDRTKYCPECGARMEDDGWET